MAERRMFAKSIIDSDAFLDMPLSTQSLYFHLSMRADDDGFVNNPKRISRLIGASDDELKVLAAKKFILGFESGVIVIKHWRIHNLIQKDRYKSTNYVEEKSQLIVDEVKNYHLDTGCIQLVSGLDTECEQVGNTGKDRLGKDSLGEDSLGDKADKPLSTKQLLSSYGIEGQLATDFINHRKAKKAAITTTAMDGFVREAKKASVSMPDAVKFSIESNWQGFRADWYFNATSVNGTKADAINARNKAVLDEWLAAQGESHVSH